MEKFGSRVAQANKKLEAARKLDKELVSKKKALETETNEAKAAASAAESKAKLITLASEITRHHHRDINYMFRNSEPKNLTKFFEAFVGLLRNIKNPTSLDVMLYFQGREANQDDEAHKSL